ncbi:RNA polymerase factor sigma-54 [Halodesulfovibrio marinisediminis]|uniref:RNA polymerase, sigma 54 subunit, RpoN/SigL n=1 Tax=Halodesulfovibrio marinisediminis DSM 17456 TaxID=1121457 RepID=A0A1N6E701_9BACT|nr:RNA polymerase factor sigma-54 [Halodesulfovibrio marinisediminis]SIN78792.1 RNA polymerase, sigma 54 subunit, RpoN/SigL [Halodesulfovibrio marinisediminis DSM 17456]
MALELRQQLKLAQQLVMTPQLQQAIKLLQLSRVELAETVQQELLENPFLEESLEERVNPDKTSDAEQRKNEQEAYDKELSNNADWEDYLGDFSSTTKQVSMRESEALEEMSSFEARLAPAPTLDGHLNWQLMLSPLTKEQIRVGEVVIGNISSNGYLHVSSEELAQIAQSDVETVEQMIAHIQQFDPVGVAARTPQECLLVQVKALNYDRDPILVDIITNHLEDLEKRRYKPLARKYKISLEDLKEYLDVIQSLDPMPGARFSGGEPHYVSPDVYIYEYEGDFVIVLNEDGLPQLQLSELTEQLPKTINSEEKDYYQDKMRSASWLIKSLYQRQRTLYKVVESIVKYQKEFFQDGVTSLKPLILKDIADDIGMHESTVSRITTNKYISTPHGIFELKFFFNSAIGLDDGSQVGSESVKALIKKLISEENTKKPLSDEKIGEILKEKLQVNIARRTVAKYRTAMNIPSSSKRKVVF